MCACIHTHTYTQTHTVWAKTHQTHINADTILVACKSTASIHTHTYTQTHTVWAKTHQIHIHTDTIVYTHVFTACVHEFHTRIHPDSLSLTHPHTHTRTVWHTHTLSRLTHMHTHTHKHTWVIVKTRHLFIVAVQTHHILCIDVFLQGGATKPTHTYHTRYTHYTCHWCVPAGRCYQTYTHISHMLHTHTHYTGYSHTNIFPIKICAAQLQNVSLSVLLMCTGTNDETLTTTATYFSHPRGKLKLSFDTIHINTMDWIAHISIIQSHETHTLRCTSLVCQSTYIKALI